jgi:hypothetical protein
MSQGPLDIRIRGKTEYLTDGVLASLFDLFRESWFTIHQEKLHDSSAYSLDTNQENDCRILFPE